MRLRKKSNINEKILNFADVVVSAKVEMNEERKGNWRNLFNVATDKKLFVELGTGKGDFISRMGEINPEVCFVGLEMEATVVYAAARKVREKNLSNVRLAVFDINNVDSIFDVAEVDRLYINFCDPWPKKRHAKRRLTYVSFLDKYQKILKSGGEIHFKTDNRGLFDFSLEQFALKNLNVSEISYDLHANEPADNIQTEYERKFSGLGFPICRCVIKFN